jgi:hypothetical protein
MYNGKGSKNSDFGLGVQFERKSLFGVCPVSNNEFIFLDKG